MNKEVRVGFRLRESEKASLEKKAKKDGLKLSKYLRNIISNTDGIFSLTDKQVSMFQDEFANLTRLGSNIHQIARRLNIRYSNNEKGEEDYYLIKASEIDKLREDVLLANKNIAVLKGQLGAICKEHKID